MFLAAAISLSCDAAALSTQTKMRGGASDTDVNEFTVTPQTADPSARAETTATPVGNRPMTSLN